MMKKITILVLISVIAFLGCSTKDNPLEPVYSEGKMMRGFVNSTSLETSLLVESSGRSIYVYEPYGYTVGSVDSYEVVIDSIQPGGYHYDTTYTAYTVTGTEYPTLYLLHGYGGSYDYFQTLFLIQDVLDEMIANGEIIPMLVITPDCDTQLGGSFYSDSPDIGGGISFDGNFESFVTEDLIEYVNSLFNADTTAAKRGIGGHSMGGYGAMKLAMKHPDLYGSVSAMSAPLRFSYLAGLLPTVYAENGLAYGSDTTAIDTAGFYSIEYNEDNTVSSMMFAMGSAFTPHTLLDNDTTYFHRLSDIGAGYFLGVDLPFVVNGTLDTLSTVWQNWLANDPYTMLATNNYQAAFDDIPVYIDCGSADDLGLNYHAQAFDAVLTAKNITHTTVIYDGYEGNDAGHANLIAERIREVLKFHSDAFQEAE